MVEVLEMLMDDLNLREGWCSQVKVVLSHPSRHLPPPRIFDTVEKEHMIRENPLAEG